MKKPGPPPANIGPWLRPVDALLLLYQIILGCVVVTGRSQVQGSVWLAWHLGGSLVLLLVCRATAGKTGGALVFLREWYPLILMPLLYKEVGPLVHGYFDWTLDPILYSLDRRVFLGGGPALWEWQQAHPPARWVNEFFHVGYGAYFLLMPIGGFALWFRAPRAKFRTYMFALGLTYYASYLLFILLPAHSPRFFVEGLRDPLPGYAWSDLLKLTMDENAYPGGSFPSSHVAAAFIVFGTYPYLGRWKGPLFLLTLVLFAGTVWGRYHYVSDLAAGLLLGAFILKTAPSVERFFQNRLDRFPILALGRSSTRSR